MKSIKPIYAIVWVMACLLTTHHVAQAQEKLTLTQAMQIASSQNLGLKRARQQASIAQNNVYRGNAGLLPTITAQGGINYSNNNATFEFASGDTQSQNGAISVGTNASVAANYVLYNGGQNQLNYKNLKVAAEQSNITVQQTKQNVLVGLVASYYNIAELQENYRVAQEAVKISKDRLERAKSRQEFGSANSVNVLNAEVSLNNDNLTVIQLAQQLQNAKRNLNVFLGRDLNQEFVVDSPGEFKAIATLEALKQEAYNKNVALKNIRQNRLSSEVNLRLAKGQNLPTVSLNASYGYSRNQNQAGFILVNQSLGLSAGLTINYTIFDGNRRKKNIENAKISLDVNKTQFEEIKQQVDRDMTNAYANYQNNLNVMKLNQQNAAIAQKNFNAVQSSYKLGQSTNTAFREAQLGLVRAKINLINAKFRAKLAEMNVLLLTGRLLEDSPGGKK
ncbi:TolC family protein [uncultured Microscilla sp.]|uniref:TolC family protein n=1 Tax=uncultured Microscilla sp. TaxID=432653 RepID=UPI002638B89A|nr:TolC family protein [uncultured Microscilla sp.]